MNYHVESCLIGVDGSDERQFNCAIYLRLDRDSEIEKMNICNKSIRKLLIFGAKTVFLRTFFSWNSSA